MKILYIILAHKNPDQLFRLVDRLKEPWTKFYIHIDKNIDIKPFIHRFPEQDNIVFLLNDQRESGTWGDIGIVKGILNAMDLVVKENNFGTCILLSGQDYPLMTNQKIYSFFSENSKTLFIDIFRLPYKGWENGGLKRINRYKINKSNFRGHYIFLPSLFDKDFYSPVTLGKINYLRKTGNWFAISKIFKKRKFPEGILPYGGSVYWALPLERVKDILKFVKKHPHYIRYHKYTLSADELFFHSILMAIKTESAFTIEPSLTYVNWQKKNGPPPVTFESEDFEELRTVSKKYIFARKFDEEIDKSILDKIDEELLR